MTDVSQALMWLSGALGTALVTVMWFGIRVHLNSQAKQQDAMRDLENTAITNTQFTGFAQRIDKRIESMQAHFDGAMSELRSDNRKIVSTVVQLLNKP